MTDKRLQTILAATKRGLQKLYGPRLKGVVLYGSYARGAATPDSDIDVAVILDDYLQIGQEIYRSAALASRICLRFDTLVALLPVREREWLTDDSPLMLNVRQEGVPL